MAATTLDLIPDQDKTLSVYHWTPRNRSLPMLIYRHAMSSWHCQLPKNKLTDINIKQKSLECDSCFSKKLLSSAQTVCLIWYESYRMTYMVWVIPVLIGLTLYIHEWQKWLHKDQCLWPNHLSLRDHMIILKHESISRPEYIKNK